MKNYPKIIDLSQYADDEQEAKNGRYGLSAIIAFPHKTALDKGMYSAIVKKRIGNKTKKQWLVYENGKFEIIDKDKASCYEAQVLFYTRTLANDDGEDNNEV